MTDFNFENFMNVLEQKEVPITQLEAQEFFDDISNKLQEETNVFDVLTENEVLERVTEMLAIMPPDTLLELNVAKISALLKCSPYKFRELCYKFSQNTVSCNEYYSVNPDNIDYLITRSIFGEDEFLTEDEIENRDKFEYEHLVQSFDTVDDFDKNVDSIMIEV